MTTHDDRSNPDATTRNRPRFAFLTLPASRRGKWLVLVIWFVVIAAASPFAGRLKSVEQNGTSAWLPGNAESLVVDNLLANFPQGDTTTAVIIYRRDSGLTADDQASIDAGRQMLSMDLGLTAIGSVVRSEDGTSTIYSIPLSSGARGDISDQVKQIRERLAAAAHDGLTVKLTGPAGFDTDMSNVSSGIDTTLLLAAALVVIILLLFTYRSPFVWLIPLVSVVVASQLANGVFYGLVRLIGLSVNSRSGGILPVLVVGTGTDYALLLIARYREELRHEEDHHLAMARAMQRAAPAILASAATVIISLLCLLAADLNPTRGLGPVGAVAIFITLLAMLTLLPALFAIFGRRVFWPLVPVAGSTRSEASSLWSGIGRLVARAPRLVWATTALGLVVMSAALLSLNANLPQADQFRSTPESIAGQKLIARSFAAGLGEPDTVVANAVTAAQVKNAISATGGVVDVQQSGQSGNLVAFSTTLSAPPSSRAAFETIDRLRDNVHAVPGANALVGGSDAMDLDVARANARDELVVMPLVLVTVLIVLGVLLRAIVAPLVLVATVVLSYGAALGMSTLVFSRIFGFAGIDPSIPLVCFVLLVALGIDYNIFLMSRIHEESGHLGTWQGTLRGLSVTGGVITSAGIVLAATFSVLVVLPLVPMNELGFIVAFGVLLDTFIVRSILVPALTLDLGRRIWWPSSLSRHSRLRVERQETIIEHFAETDD